MDTPTLALAIKKASEVAAEVAERVARSIVPERGPAGRDGLDGRNGIDGRDGVDGKDGRDGKDGVGVDGKPGKDANRWHLVYGEPDEDLGNDDDFALDGRSSNVYHKVDGEWEFVVHLKSEGAGMSFLPAAQPSETKIEEIINRLISKPNIAYANSDYTVQAPDDIILADGDVTITIPAAPGNAGCTLRIKNIGTGDVAVESVNGLIDGEACQVLNVQYYAIDVVSDGANWVIL